MGYDEESNSEYEMNWDDVGTVLPNDTKVDLVVEKAEYKWRPNSKSHGANVTFKITGVYDDEHQKFVDKKIFENFTFSQAAGFNAKKFLNMAEIEKPKFITKEAIEELCESMVGAEVGATTKIEKFNEDNRTKIKSYWLVGTGGETERKAKKEEEEEEKDSKEEEEEEKDEEEEEEEEDEKDEEDEEEEEDEDEEEEEEKKPEPKTSMRKKSLREAAQTKAPAKAAAPAKKAAGKKK